MESHTPVEVAVGKTITICPAEGITSRTHFRLVTDGGTMIEGFVAPGDKLVMTRGQDMASFDVSILPSLADLQ